MVHRHKMTEKLELLRKMRAETPLLSEKHPEVSGIVINMTYYQNLPNPILMVRTLNIFPTSHAFFQMECMSKECEGGGFQLKSAISGMIKLRKRSAKGKMECKGKGEGLEEDHASISYEIKIKYKRVK